MKTEDSERLLTPNEKMALLEVSLTKAAERLGDITEPVMARFYEHYPEALAAFERLGLGSRQRLEAQMVENIVYCLMNWFDRSDEIEIILLNSVPHHQRTLDLNPAWYGGMVVAAIDVITAAIDRQSNTEQRLWAELRQGLSHAIETAGTS